MDKIFLSGMRFHGYHGCLEFEREQGQAFIVDLTLGVDLQAAGQSDDLKDTVNYALVFDAVRAVVEGEPCNLIEAVAERIAARVLSEFPEVTELTVRVNKPGAPIEGDFENVAVEVMRCRK